MRNKGYISISEHMAPILYPAMPLQVRAAMSQEEFEDVITRILVEAGDLIDEQLASDEGLEHGIINVPGGGWLFDDNDEPYMHVSLEYAAFFDEEEGEL